MDDDIIREIFYKSDEKITIMNLVAMSNNCILVKEFLTFVTPNFDIILKSKIINCDTIKLFDSIDIELSDNIKKFLVEYDRYEIINLISKFVYYVNFNTFVIEKIEKLMINKYYGEIDYIIMNFNFDDLYGILDKYFNILLDKCDNYENNYFTKIKNYVSKIKVVNGIDIDKLVKKRNTHMIKYLLNEKIISDVMIVNNVIIFNGTLEYLINEIKIDFCKFNMELIQLNDLYNLNITSHQFLYYLYNRNIMFDCMSLFEKFKLKDYHIMNLIKANCIVNNFVISEDILKFFANENMIEYYRKIILDEPISSTYVFLNIFKIAYSDDFSRQIWKDLCKRDNILLQDEIIKRRDLELYEMKSIKNFAVYGFVCKKQNQLIYDSYLLNHWIKNNSQFELFQNNSIIKFYKDCDSDIIFIWHKSIGICDICLTDNKIVYSFCTNRQGIPHFCCENCELSKIDKFKCAECRQSWIIDS
jgi:hypothetical protein